MTLKKNKKIAYISTIASTPWGGSEELWYLSAEIAIKKQDTIGIFMYDWNPLPNKVKDLCDKGANIFLRSKKTNLLKRILLKICHKFNFFYPLFLNPYKDLIRFKPDIIVITDGRTYYTANDEWLQNILTKYFNNKFIIIAQANSPRHYPNNRLNAINLFQQAKKIVFVSNRNREECFHQLGENLNNTVVIQNPINIKKNDLIPIPKILTNDTIHIAVVGRLSVNDKGQDMLLTMMANNYWKNKNICIHFYGDGTDKAYLNKLIKYYGVEDKVFIEGFKDIYSIYKKCHCLLMPSIQEGTSLAMLEAMALGKVCIITDVGGSSEWIDDGLNGFLIEAPTVKLIELKLKLAIENIDKWPIIGKNAHEKILKDFDQFPGQTLYNNLNI